MVEASGLYDMAYIEAQIEAGEMHFWPRENCVAVTEFLIFPRAKVLNIFAAAGVKGKSLRALTKELEPALLAFANANGCNKIFASGIKPEWRPVGEALGYSHRWTVMAKDLT